MKTMAPIRITSPAGTRAAKKISLAEYTARRAIKPQQQSAVTKAPPSTPLAAIFATASLPSPPASCSLGLSPEASISDPGSPLWAKALRRLSRLPVASKPKPKPRARSPAPYRPDILEPEEDFSLFNKPVDNAPVDRAAIQANKEARREAALARACKITNGPISRPGGNQMASVRASLDRINKSLTSKSRGRARKRRLSKLAGSSGTWIDVEMQAETSSASIEAPRFVRQHQKQQQQEQPQTAEEKAIAARREADLEEYRIEVGKVFSDAGNTHDGRCIGVIGTGATMGFRDERKEAPKDKNPMRHAQAATQRMMGGLRY